MATFKEVKGSYNKGLGYIKKGEKYALKGDELQKLEYKLEKRYGEFTAQMIKWSEEKSKELNRPYTEILEYSLVYANYLDMKGYDPKEIKELIKNQTELKIKIINDKGYNPTDVDGLIKGLYDQKIESLNFFGIDEKEFQKMLKKDGIIEVNLNITSDLNEKYNTFSNKTSLTNENQILDSRINRELRPYLDGFNEIYVPLKSWINSGISSAELNNEISRIEENIKNIYPYISKLKDDVIEFDSFKQQEDSNPDLAMISNKKYQEIIIKYPFLENKLLNNSDSSGLWVKNWANLESTLKEAAEQSLKDKWYDTNLLKIGKERDYILNATERNRETRSKNFHKLYQYPIEDIIKDSDVILAARDYNDLERTEKEYNKPKELKKIIDVLIKNETFKRKFGSYNEWDGNPLKQYENELLNTIAEDVAIFVKNQDSDNYEISRIMEKTDDELRTLKNGYENYNPLSEYGKYIKEEFSPKFSEQMNILKERLASAVKPVEEFDSNMKVKFDTLMKDDVIRQDLENYKKSQKISDYEKLKKDLNQRYGLADPKGGGPMPAAYLYDVYDKNFDQIQTAIKNITEYAGQSIQKNSTMHIKAFESSVKTSSEQRYKMEERKVNGKTYYIPVKKNDIPMSEAEKNLMKLTQSYNNVQRGMGKNPAAPIQKTATQTVKVQRKVQQPQRTVTYREPTKWEVMSKELKKAVKDLESKAGKMGDVILKTSDKLAKLELEKLHNFSDVMGMSESDVLFSEIGILEKQRQIALEVGKKEKVESLTAEIKEKKKKAENAKFYDDINGSYEQKTNQLNFKPSDEQYDDFKEKFAGYYDGKMENLTRLLVNGLITKNQFEKNSLDLIEEKIQRLIEMKKYDEAVKLTIEKYQAEYTKIQEDAQKDLINIREKGEVFGYRKSEIINQELEREKKLRSDSYEKNKQTEEILNKELENLNEKLEKAIKNNDKNEMKRIREEIDDKKKEKEELGTEEKAKKDNEKISKKELEYNTAKILEALSDGIRDIFKNINPKDFRGSLANNIDSLFEKQFNVLLDEKNPYNSYKSVIEEKMKEAFEGYQVTGDYVLDQSEYNKRFEEFLDRLIGTGNEGLINLAGSMKMERVKTSLDDLASTLSRAGSVLKDDFLTNLSVTAESLSGLTSIFQNTNLAGPIGEKIGGLGNFLSPFTSVVGTVFGTVNAGVSLFRSFGIGSNKNKKHNEEEKRKANEWYENKSKENENLFSEINTLTNSIQNLTTKLIQNIASDTSDKNIAKQKSYYNTLIGKTGDLYEGQITATGHSSKKKGLFGGKKNSHATLSQGFDEYFGSVWKNTARDSGSLQSFYDTYLQNFDLNTLKRKLGKSKLDNNNIEEVKLSFLRFIEDVRVMEQYSLNLPKNGILESFEGVEVADLFELRNEYQKQLEDIYKGMGKDPEKYRDEILSTVNSLIQNDQVIVSAFQDVKSRTIEQLSSGNDVILGLATGMESYFSKLESNFSKVFYDMKFQGFEEKFSNKFENLTNNLADFRLSGRKDFDNFLNENLNFWDLFTDLKNTEYIENDMKHIIDTLKNQAQASGLSDEVINAMFPDEKINEKTEKIKNVLENSIRKALETNSFEQFSMSLGESIYNNVKDSLVKAFYESQSFQTLADKYFLTEDYKNALDGAGSFKDAYSIIQQKLNEVELKLQSEGMDFRGTNAVDGNYYGMSGKQEYKTSGILDNSKGVEFAVTLNNYGFMSNSEFMNTLKKEMKEFLYESGKEEV